MNVPQEDELLKQQVEEMIHRYKGSTDDLYQIFLQLYDQYKKMQKENELVVKISDTYQRKIMSIKEELEVTNKKLERVASRDHLTGLYNRQEFERVIVREWNNAIRYDTPISMMMIDIDNFKLYNDNYGHLSGDHCLQKLSRVLDKTLKRPRDFLARFGGEEFVVVLPDTESSGAKHIGEKVRQAVIQQQIPHEFSDIEPFVTVSIGIATTEDPALLVYEDMLDEADKALYQSKRKGKNRCLHVEM